MFVRIGRRSDAPQVARIHVESWQTCYRGILPEEFLNRLSVAERLGLWQKFIDQTDQILLVCRKDRKTVGFAACGPTRDDDIGPKSVGELYAIYVLPEFWRMGCGHRLWQRTHGELKRAKFAEVMLWVLKANARARRFYEREGFEFDSSAVKDALVGGVKLQEVRYRMRLSL